MNIFAKLVLGAAVISMAAFAFVGSAEACSDGHCKHHHAKKQKAKKRITQKRAPKKAVVTPTITPKPAATSPVSGPLPQDPLALASCHANELQHLVGKDRTVLHTMRFGVQVRFEEPGMMYTADYIETRLRIQIGEDGKIKRVFCG